MNNERSKELLKRDFDRAWYIDKTPDKRYSVGGYPEKKEDGINLCSTHAKKLGDDVEYDVEINKQYTCGLCWICA